MTDIVVFGEDFGGLPSSTQHLIKHLAKNHRISLLIYFQVDTASL